jgi:hypothetical protein
MKKIFFFTATLLFAACNKEKYFDGPNQFSDDFESYNQFDELFGDDDLLWSFYQSTFTENNIEVDTTFAHSGTHSIKSTAMASNDELGASKSSYSKQNMAFWEGEIMVVSAWYYLVGEADAQWIFFMDLEEQAAIGAGPGMRLAMVDNAIRVEHKFLNPDIIQPEGQEVLFPRNQWVQLTFETKLSQKKDGYVKIYQDNQLIIEQYNWKTLPTDLLYFQQGTKGMYSSIEFGITANSFDNDMVLYVDDVEAYVK